MEAQRGDKRTITLCGRPHHVTYEQCVTCSEWGWYTGKIAQCVDCRELDPSPETAIYIPVAVSEIEPPPIESGWD